MRHLFWCADAIRLGLPLSANRRDRHNPRTRAKCCFGQIAGKYEPPAGMSYVYVIDWAVDLPCPLPQNGLLSEWRHVGEGDPQGRLWQHFKSAARGNTAIPWLPPIDVLEEVVRHGFPSVRVRPWRETPFPKAGIARDGGPEREAWLELHGLYPGHVTGAQMPKPKPIAPEDWKTWARAHLR